MGLRGGGCGSPPRSAARCSVFSGGRRGSCPLSAVERRPCGPALPGPRASAWGCLRVDIRWPCPCSEQLFSPNFRSTPVSGPHPRASPCTSAPLTAQATWYRAGRGGAAGGGSAAARGAARARAAHRRARPVPPPRRCCCHRRRPVSPPSESVIPESVLLRLLATSRAGRDRRRAAPGLRPRATEVATQPDSAMSCLCRIICAAFGCPYAGGPGAGWPGTVTVGRRHGPCRAPGGAVDGQPRWRPADLNRRQSS